MPGPGALLSPMNCLQLVPKPNLGPSLSEQSL